MNIFQKTPSKHMEMSSQRGYYVFRYHPFYYIFYDCHLRLFEAEIVSELQSLSASDLERMRELVADIDENYDYEDCERAGFNGILNALENPMAHDLLNITEEAPKVDDYIEWICIVDLDDAKCSIQYAENDYVSVRDFSLNTGEN